jgi:SPP1 gp7 family putative phage head morphogenesis protein
MRYVNWRFFKATERRLFVGINFFTKLVKELLKTTNTVEELAEAVAAITESKRWQELAQSEAEQMVRATVVQSSKDWREAAKNSGRSREIYEALSKEMGQSQRFQDIIKENAQAITGLPEQVSQKITKTAAKQAIAGRRPEAIEESVRRLAPEISESKARAIARTETAKTQAAITEVRANQTGVQWYIWRTSEDARVRKSHKHINGVWFQFSQPPSPETIAGEKSQGNYNPGCIYNCRCFSAPIIDLEFESFPAKVYEDGVIKRKSRKEMERYFP